MTCGDVVVVAVQGDYGKPRPAVVIQSDVLNESESVLIVPFTSTLRDAPFYRHTVTPSGSNGLQTVSQVMVDTVTPCPRTKCGPIIGRLSREDMMAVSNKLSVMIGLAD